MCDQHVCAVTTEKNTARKSTRISKESGTPKQIALYMKLKLIYLNPEPEATSQHKVLSLDTSNPAAAKFEISTSKPLGVLLYTSSQLQDDLAGKRTPSMHQTQEPYSYNSIQIK